MYKLSGKRIIVAGGVGFVGGGITRNLLESGAEVLAISCSQICIEKFQGELPSEYHSRFHSLSACLGTTEGDEALQQELRKAGKWDGAVACLGMWAPKSSLVDLPPQDLVSLINSNLIAHIRFMQIALPELGDGAQYIQINGVGMDKPIPNAGIMSVFDAATHMLKTVAAEEWQQSKVTIYTLALQNHVKEDNIEQHGYAFTPDTVGKRILSLLAEEKSSHRHGRTLRWAHDWQQTP